MPAASDESAAKRLLHSVGLGDREASDALLRLLFEELRRLASRELRRLPPNQTLQPTALVHEAYLRLMGRGDLNAQGRRDFLRLSARAMHDVLVEAARSKASQRRGGNWKRVDAAQLELATEVAPEEVLALDEALERLAGLDPRKAEIVRLRFFTGMTQEDIADVIGVSLRTVRREWNFARSWLAKELRPRGGSPPA